MRFGFVDIQGFYMNDSNGLQKFYPKEMTISNGEQHNHYLFTQPIEFKNLSNENKEQVRNQEKIHGLQYTKGHVDYNDFSILVNEGLKHFDVVYIDGEDKYTILKEVSQQKAKLFTLKQLGAWEYPVYDGLKPNCLNHAEGKLQCTTTNCITLKTWFMSVVPGGRSLKKSRPKYELET